MKGIINGLGAFFCAVVLLCLLSPEAFAQGPRVLRIVGKAEIYSVAEKRGVPAIIGQALHRGDRIQVVGKGTVVIQKKKGAIEAVVTGGSKLEYLGRSFWKRVERFAVPEGVIRFKIMKGKKLDVKTPHMVASVRGTEFITKVQSDLSTISVISGTVLVRDFYGGEQLLGPNSSINASKDGFVAGEDDLDEKADSPVEDLETPSGKKSKSNSKGDEKSDSSKGKGAAGEGGRGKGQEKGQEKDQGKGQEKDQGKGQRKGQGGDQGILKDGGKE